MGYGSYSASDWVKLKNSRNLSRNQSVEEVFTKKQCDPKYDPKYDHILVNFQIQKKP